jgi:DNA polymerase-3 subunit epsilon
VFAPRIAFVDVETTGSSPVRGRVTEVGVVLVEARDGQWAAQEWSSLVNPGMPIPPEIAWLTGITNDMVREAPPFAEIAAALAEQLADAVFVAHNARFDYGFLKHEFERAGLSFAAKTLCTVRLSRDLYPDRAPHSLDAIIARHDLPVRDRHRALGDARVLWDFVQTMYREHPAPRVEESVKRLLKRSSLPSHLPPDALQDLPKAPGVYLFYGLNDHPIYIGKSVNLRERVGSHFTNDYRSERELRLSQETMRIEWEETAGEWGALLREGALIKERLPAHNIALRRRERRMVLRFDEGSCRPRFVPAAAVQADRPEQYYGVFGSRASARWMLVELAREHGLCLKAMGLERRRKGEPAGLPCFNFQLRRCRGCCVGTEGASEHAARLAEALAAYRLPAWPYPGPVAWVEKNPARLREDVHVFHRWGWLGTVRSLEAAFELARQAAPPVFEPDVQKLLQAILAAPDTELVALS